MWKWLIGLFLVAHGLVHLAVWTMPQKADAPFDARHSWALQGGGVSADGARAAAIALAIVAATIFVVAGASLLMGFAAWRPITVVGSVAGLVVAVLFFNPWLSLDVAINAGLLLGVTVWAWPSTDLVGA